MSTFLQGYDLAGLLLQSNCPLQLPVVPTDGRPSDIIIRQAAIDGSAFVAVESLGGWQISGEEVLLTVPDVGRFLVRGDRQAIVEPTAGAAPATVRSDLAGSVMGMLCHRRDILPLHASAITVGANGVAAFIGRSGAGKSTMVAAVARQGHNVPIDVILIHKGRTDLCHGDRGREAAPYVGADLV